MVGRPQHPLDKSFIMTTALTGFTASKRLPGYLDRYPAKMVARLAEVLVAKYVSPRGRLLDPFCGSGAILAAAKSKDIEVCGLDISPYAVLLTNVKLNGFDKSAAHDLCTRWVTKARFSKRKLPIYWDEKNYWFTEATLEKYERLRYVGVKMDLNGSREGQAALLAYALSIRRCSRADQRSPKPFISKSARERRYGRHFDPLKEMFSLLHRLGELYGRRSENESQVRQINVASLDPAPLKHATFSNVITSPPYINAQDYFRNSKLELHLLESLLPFVTDDVKNRFIGTERGPLLEFVPKSQQELYRTLLPQLLVMEQSHPRSAAVICRYLYDMSNSFDRIKTWLKRDGILVLVCGDNLVAGQAISTWRLLNQLLTMRGFKLFDSFGDHIDRRTLPPKRNGHKGLIKEEIVSAFKLC
jgi:hypothetical protein